MFPTHCQNSRPTPVGSASIAALGLLLLLGTSPVRAADRTWTGGGDGTSFGSASNWGGDAPPTGSDGANIGSGTPVVTANPQSLTTLNVTGGTLEISSGARAAVSGGFSLSGSGVVQGAGTLGLTAPGNQTGGAMNVTTLILQGTSYSISNGTLGSSTTSVAGNGTSSMIQTGGTVMGHLKAGTYTQSGGTLAAVTLDTNTYHLTTAATSVTAGKISAKILFDFSAPTGTITIGAQLHDAGALTKSGGSTVSLTSTLNDYTGATTVTDGILSVDGTIQSSITTVTGGTLKGSGTLGKTTILSLGTHAPGNSIGTETVVGDYANHGTLEIEVTPDAADKVVVQGGTVDIGDATLSVLELDPTGWPPSRSFTIIDNDGVDAVTGSFGAINSQFAFLVPTVSTTGGDGNDVVLTLLRNHVDFADLGTTSNQIATAKALEGLSDGNPLYEDILWADAGTASAVYDQLSGEGFATAKGMLIDNAADIEKQVLDRVQQAFGALGATQPNNFVGADGTPVSGDGDTGVWLSGYGARRMTGSDGNAAASSSAAGGIFAGADGQLGAWTVGAFGGYGRAGVVVDDRATSIASQDVSVGAYAATEGDLMNIAFGAAYSRHFLASRRTLTFPSAQTLTADYQAGTAQLFGEMSHRIDLGAVDIDPYAGFSYVGLASDPLQENGGAAALSSAADVTQALFTTLGVRSSASVVVGDDMLLKVRAGAAWQHAFANLPSANNSFAGGTPFTVTGSPIAADAALLDLALDLNVSPSLSVSAAYDTKIAARTRSQALRAALTGKF